MYNCTVFVDSITVNFLMYLLVIVSSSKLVMEMYLAFSFGFLDLYVF